MSSCSYPAERPDAVDTIVIGGGLMGSSAAWYISNEDNSVLLLEKQDSIYSQGSSLGQARIARSSNRSRDMWSYLHNYSVHKTSQLIQFLNSTEQENAYQLDDIYTTSPVTYVGRTRIYDVLLTSLKRQGIRFDLALTPSEGHSKFNVTLPDSILLQREYNQYSGTLNPTRLIQYLHQGIRKKGGVVKYKSEVISVGYDNSRDVYEIVVSSDDEEGPTTLISRNVVSAAGPYTGRVLKEIAPYFDTLIRPQRVFLAFLKIKAEKYHHLSENQRKKILTFYPVINSSKGGRKGSFFSMIEYFDVDSVPIIKIGGHFQRSEITDLDQIWHQDLLPSEIQWSIGNTADYLSLLNLPIERSDLELVKGYSCVYSLTKSEVPFVTPINGEESNHPSRFVVMGGMSGVGAKGAMTYGLIAANTITGRHEFDSLYQQTRTALRLERLEK